MSTSVSTIDPVSCFFLFLLFLICLFVVFPSISQAFAHHVMSKKYRDAVEKFFKTERWCAMFKGVDPKAEQLLEYTEVYQVSEQ